MMTLAAISFSDPLMLAGLAAAAIPVALHLLNRIRSPIVMFPTLRFLKITAQKTSRRRQVQQYLLLLVRMAVFAMIAMAISRPLIRGGSAPVAYAFIGMFLAAMALLVLSAIWGAAAMKKKQTAPSAESTPAQPAHQPAAGAGRYWALSAATMLLAILLAGYSAFGLGSDKYFSGDKGEFTGRSTAAVIVFDNSQSMLAREDGASRLQRAKEQVRQLLSGKLRPAQAAILPTNPGAEIGVDTVTSDVTRLLGNVEKMTSTGRARPMQDRIRTAAKMLEDTSQPSKILIVVSDFARPAFADAAVFAGIKEQPAGKDLQIVLMPMTKGSPPADVGIQSFTVAEGGGHPVVGSEITFEAQVLNNGDSAELKDLIFAVDDQSVESVRPRVQLGPAGQGSSLATIKIPYRLTETGPHRFTLKLADANDAMDWDNQRQLVLNVGDQVRVLVIGPEAKPRPRSAAFYMQAALAPFDIGNTPTSKDPAGRPMGWSLKPAYRPVDEVKDYAALAGYGAVFICDVPRISESLADGLSRYVKSGGRIIWVLGTSVDAAAYNDALLGHSRELLPGKLAGPLMSRMGSTLNWVDLQSDIFANLFESQEPFRSVVVTGRWNLEGGLLRGRPLAKLADDSVLIAQNTQTGVGGEGEGEIYTVLTSPSAAWSNLGARGEVLVPMASRMALGDSGRSRGETSFETGDGMHIPVTGSAEGDRALANISLDVRTPDGAVFKVPPKMMGDLPRWYFDGSRTQAPGAYTWHGSDGKHAGVFVINPPAEEVDLLPADVDELARETGANRPTIIAPTAAELLTQLEKQSEGTPLAPGVLAMVLMLAVLEALMANRYRPASATLSATPDRTPPGASAESIRAAA